MFRALINVDNDLREIFKEIEQYFSITLNETVIEKIFSDAQEDQVSQKEYLIFQGKKNLFHKPMSIRGTVDEYEPSDIWLVIENIKDKDLDHFNGFTS